MKIKTFTFIFISTLLMFGTGCNLPPPGHCTANWLIWKINNANSTPATTDVITLKAGCTYIIDEINNLDYGNTGLPTITSSIVIRGNRAIILRRADNPEKFRLLSISSLGNLDISDVTLTGGHAYNDADPDDWETNSGGAIFNKGHLAVYRSLIQENTAKEGGGIYNGFYMTLAGVTVDSNHDYGGNPGGAGLHNGGTATIENSTFSHNGVPEGKDGIYNGYYRGTMVMTNSTVSHNGIGGFDNEGDLTLNHVTIAYNGTGAFASCGNLYISNSIIAQPPGTVGCPCQHVFATLPIIDTTGTCGGNVVDIASIRLAPLAYNGGPTQTYALLPGSVAIDIVDSNCLPTDQRGELRPFGIRCDAGAYEFVGVLPLVITPTSTSTFTLTPSITVPLLPTWTTTPPPAPAPIAVQCAGLTMSECSQYPTTCKWVPVLTHVGGGYCTDQ